MRANEGYIATFDNGKVRKIYIYIINSAFLFAQNLSELYLVEFSFRVLYLYFFYYFENYQFQAAQFDVAKLICRCLDFQREIKFLQGILIMRP